LGLLIAPFAYGWAAQIRPPARYVALYVGATIIGTGILWNLLDGVQSENFGTFLGLPAHALADPLGLKKYMLGAMLIASNLSWLSWSFLHARSSAFPAKFWCFRAALVFLVLSSFWIKIQLYHGDEPQYLMLASSLADQGDIVIDDDYRRGSYHEFLHVTMSDTRFLAGWSVDLDHPRGRIHYFFGASAFLAPLYFLLLRFHLPPYLFRVILGIPLLMLSAAALARACRYLSDERGHERWGMTLCYLFLFATPLHIWSQTFSPEPLLLFLLTFAAVELAGTGGTSLRWTALAIFLMPWMHPRTFPFVILIVAWAARVRPARRAISVALIAFCAFALKICFDAYTMTGLYVGYVRNAVKLAQANPGKFIVSWLSHWVSADAGYLFYAPIMLCILFSLPALCLGRFISREKRAATCFITACLMFDATRSTSDLVTGFGRLAFWWIPFGMALALSSGEARKGYAIAAVVVGGFWNLFLTEFTILQMRMPSAALRDMLKIEPAWIAPQLSRRASIEMHRGVEWEIALSLAWIVAIVFLYARAWKPVTAPNEREVS
jgi:hypothetical protein